MVQGSEIKVKGLRFRVESLGWCVKALRVRPQCPDFMVKGSGVVI